MTYYLVMAGLIIFGYLLGNVNFSILLSKLINKDIRKYGSGNPGAINMMRSFGAKMGALTLVTDAIKGAIPAVLGWFLLGKGEMFTFGEDKIGIFIGGLSVIIGHIYPVFYKFKGGKGVASSVGVGFVSAPLVAGISLLCAFIFLLTVKIGAIASFICIGVPLIYSSVVAFVGGRIAQGILPLVMYLIVLIAHRANIKRIFKGEERKLTLFGKNATHKTIQENKTSEQSTSEQEQEINN